ncbi:MAG: hypothetical protein GF393_02205 [Armatimonadia bacterium]|nr:hypothetical protein [Armatimonadia bacterium]
MTTERNDACLVFVSGVPGGAEEIWSGLYVAHGPDWKPKLVLDSRASKHNEGMRVAGQSSDRGKVWLLGSRFTGRDRSVASAYTGELRVYDASSNVSSVIANTEDTAISHVLPSPDGDLLAVVAPPAVETIAPRDPLPLQVIDTNSGVIHTVARPPWRSGTYLMPLCWSAGDKRGLYFVDHEDNLWRLDLPQSLQ